MTVDIDKRVAQIHAIAFGMCPPERHAATGCNVCDAARTTLHELLTEVVHEATHHGINLGLEASIDAIDEAAPASGTVGWSWFADCREAVAGLTSGRVIDAANIRGLSSKLPAALQRNVPGTT